ncbi:hypothetical protein ABZ922_30900 [Streptomyces shenzhenensis]
MTRTRHWTRRAVTASVTAPVGRPVRYAVDACAPIATRTATF